MAGVGTMELLSLIMEPLLQLARIELLGGGVG